MYAVKPVETTGRMVKRAPECDTDLALRIVTPRFFSLNFQQTTSKKQKHTYIYIYIYMNVCALMYTRIQNLPSKRRL